MAFVSVTLNTNMNSFHLFPIISIFIFLIVVSPSYCDHHYEQLSACRIQHLYRCGRSAPLNISYPFWGGGRPPYCGRNGFEIKCDQDKGYHFIEFDAQKFIILNITYNDRRMTIARADLWDDYCPGIITYRDTVFDKVHFKYDPKDRNLSFFYDCDEEISPQRQDYFSCKVHGEVIAGFYAVDTLQNTSNTCESGIKVPVILVDFLPGHLGQALKRGFVVEYNADNMLCAQCLATRGICASNKSNSEQFICLCPDKSQPQTCPLEHPRGLGPTSHRNMNNHHLFPTPILHFIITIFFFLIVLPLSHCYDDEDQFSHCRSPYRYGCGTSVLNISYPFWGGDRPPYCGHEAFKIECQINEYHLMDFGTQKFRVLNIHASRSIMTIARDDLWNNYCAGCCPGIVTKDTIIDSSRFKYAPNVRNVSFFHECDEKLPPDSPTIFNCTVETGEKAGFYVADKSELQLSNLRNTCKVEIKVPVLLSALDDLVRTVNLQDLQELLKKGFEVEYMAEDERCAACNLSGGICGSNSSAPFVCLCRDHDEPQELMCPPSRPGRQPNKKLKAIIGVTAGFGGMIIMAVVSLIWVRNYRKKHAPSPYTSRNISSDPSSVADPEKADKFLGVHLFTYPELEEATNNFDSAKELGDGGFGTVYYGKLHDGRAVAVKRLYENNYKRVEQFMNEVEILAHLRHKNLVTLYGCTSRHCRELLLVYEFVSNGTVADHLHGERAKPGALPWAIRLNIAIETASALQYLHASTIIHRDVKTNNILLDDNFCVKVADFGLSRLFPDHVTHVSTAPQGTPGYVDPEYHQCYQLTDKSDVFSFGVVLVELISSLPAVDITRHRHEINLSNLFINKTQNKSLHELVDPCLGFESDYKVRKMIYAVAELAFQCLQGDKDLRPCMATVLEILKVIQSDGYSKDKAEELDISDDVGLLKNGPPTPSPDSRTSTKTTPPTSN